MKPKIIYLILLITTTNLFAQTPQKGYIIDIDGTSVFIDYTSSEIKIGDRLQIISEPKVMLHPITKKKIIKQGELIATLEITETYKEYSVAGRLFPPNAINKLHVGDKVILPGDNNAGELPQDGKVTVAIADATINDVVGAGYFGNYVADMLMQEMLECDKIRVIDRSMLNAQIDEASLAESGYINSDNAILKGQIAGVQYMVQVTMQRPDVTNITTGIPLKSLLTAAGAVANIAGASENINKGLATSAAVSSNIRKAKLKAAVNLTARVVDVQTGEVLFMCSGSGTSQGDSQLAMEEGALGGLQINGGVEGFRQTVTGKAVALAYRKIGTSLKSYFNGETSEKVIKNGFLDTEMTWRKGRIFMGINRLNNNDLREICSETPQLYFDFKKGKTQKTIGEIMMGIGTAGFCFSALELMLIDNDYSDMEESFIGGITGWYYDSPILIILYGTVFIATDLAGYIISHKLGIKKIHKSINVYNQNFHKTSYKPEFNIGLSPGGLALQLKF